MKPGGARNKGANGEREVIKHLQPIVDKEYAAVGLTPIALLRNLEQVRSGGCDLSGLNWIAVEVKRCETLAIDKWWSQTTRQADECSVALNCPVAPVLIYKQNFKKWKVVMLGGCRVDKGKWVPMRVEISFDNFKKWFRLRIRQELLELSKAE